MFRRVLLVVALLSPLALTLTRPGIAAEPRRVALVIGNGGYLHVDRLKNPDTDARLMAATLHRLGFALVGGGAQLDLDRSRMEAAIHRFRDAIGPGVVAFFYYSGHGVQVDGTNYLVPVNAAPAVARDVPVQMVAADLVVQDMADAGAALNIVVLDACRNNPFLMDGTAAQDGQAGRGLRAGGTAASGPHVRSGLAEMHAPPGTVLSFATEPGSVAYDGAPGTHDSPYTTALAEALPVPGLDVVAAFNRAGIEVGRLTAMRQEPWLETTPIEHPVFLAGPAAAGAPPRPMLAAVSAAPIMAARAPAMREAAPSPRTAGSARADGGLCPAAGLQAVRNGAEQVLYQGAQRAAPDICLAAIGGVLQARVDGIWPANWPGAAQAAAVLRRVMAAPAGTQAGFDVSTDVQNLRDVVSSQTWRFTLTNEGPATLMVGRAARPVTKLRWDERNLAQPYHAQAQIALDAATGAVLAQNFQVLLGGSAASYDFWSAYQGGVGGVPDFRVTALN